MLGKIIAINENVVSVKIEVNVYDFDGLIGKNVTFKDENITSIGEVTAIGNGIMQAILVGEIKDGKFLYGDISKPSFKAICYLIDNATLDIVLNSDATNTIKLGKSYIYPDYDIKLDVGNFFSNHFAILGNSGSGKSYSVAKILQGIFYQCKTLPFYSNIFLFDAYGEYAKAFNYLNNEPTFAYKTYNTDLNSNDEILLLPPWLLGVDEYALLLEANDKSQLSLIEKTLRYVNLFIKDDETVKAYKNTILAKALLDILISGKPGPQIRDQVIGVLTKTHTDEINLESEISEPGYYRTFRQCMRVDDHNKINAIEQVTDFLQKFIGDEVTFSLPDGTFPFTLQDVSNALEFALIDEGVWKNDSVFNMMNILKVRLDSILNSDNKKYFEYPQYISLESYIDRILHTQNGKKAQIINFNINYVTERLGNHL